MVLSFFKGEGEGYVIELSIILAGGSLRIWKPCETELGRSEMRVKKTGMLMMIWSGKVKLLF